MDATTSPMAGYVTVDPTGAQKRGREIHDAPEPVTAPVFKPSATLVHLHEAAKRLERNINSSASFNPRLRMRYERARAAATKRWVAEVHEFEIANPSAAEPVTAAS